MPFFMAMLATCASASLYDALVEAPDLWADGFDVPVLPCRRGSFSFETCCQEDTDLSNLGHCFQRQSPDHLKFAREVCCDDRSAVIMTNNIMISATELGECLANCTCTDPEFPDCQCERKFLHKAMQLASLPRRWKAGFARWLTKSGRPPLRTEQDYEDCVLRNRREALRYWEHLIMTRQMATVPEPNKPVKPPIYRIPMTRENHAEVSQLQKWQVQERLERIHRKNRATKISSSTSSGSIPSSSSTSRLGVHIAMVASIGQPVFGRFTLATIRSALFHATRRKLHFHLLVDSAGQNLGDEMNPEGWFMVHTTLVGIRVMVGMRHQC